MASDIMTWLAEDLTPADGEVVSIDVPQLPSYSTAFSGLRAFVAGATGGTGQAVVQRLVQEGIPVRALVRDKTAAAVSTRSPIHA
jgi:hypothetical protein